MCWNSMLRIRSILFQHMKNIPPDSKRSLKAVSYTHLETNSAEKSLKEGLKEGLQDGLKDGLINKLVNGDMNKK